MEKRIIKFRGKRVDNGEWVYGDLFRSHPEHHSPSVSIATDEFHPVGYGSRTFYEVDPESVGRFVGLLDKSGKEMYEGDIIEHKRHDRPHSAKKIIKKVRCVVEWYSGDNLDKIEMNPQIKDNPSFFQSAPKFIGTPIDPLLKESSWGYNWSVFHDCEVIGNIYENPELLTP